jgi:phosphatidylglycerol:prolipoprotein diacylglycerol transferase
MDRAGAIGQPTSERAVASGAVDPEALVVSHWFASGEDGEPYSATIRLTGRRVGVRGTPQAGDTFVREERIDGIMPGSGPVSITTWVYGLQPGEWNVTAELIGRPDHARGDRSTERWKRNRPESIQPAAWSWRRWGLSTGPATPVKTRWAPLAPLARMPAVLPGSFTALAVLGILVGLIVQAVLVGRANISVSGSLTASMLALLFGLVGAKLWHAFLNPGPWRQALLSGWSVDGFLVVAPVVAVSALVAFGVAIGPYLDAVTPGLFFAVAIGRIGCFFTGCCAGRATHSRWSMWSSDRRVGARRIPTQLLESATGLVIGVAATLLVLGGVPGVDGAVFVAAFALYIVIRQFLLRVRAERREFSWRRSSRVFRQRS